MNSPPEKKSSPLAEPEKGGRTLDSYFDSSEPASAISRGEILLRNERSVDQIFRLNKGRLGVYLEPDALKDEPAKPSERRKTQRQHYLEEIPGTGQPEGENGSAKPAGEKKEENLDRIMVLKPGTVFRQSYFSLFFPKSVRVMADSDCEFFRMDPYDASLCMEDKDFVALLEQSYQENLLPGMLTGLPFFRTLPPKVAEVLARRADLVRHPQGATVHRAGDKVDGFNIIRSGNITVTQVQPGCLPASRFFPAGSYFGENSALMDLGIEVLAGETRSQPDYVIRGGNKMFILRNGFRIGGSPDADLSLKGTGTDKVNWVALAKDENVYLVAEQGSPLIRFNEQKANQKVLENGDQIRIGSYLLKIGADVRQLKSYKFSLVTHDTVELIRIKRNDFMFLCTKDRHIDAIFSRIRKERNRGIDDALALRKQLQEMRARRQKRAQRQAPKNREV